MTAIFTQDDLFFKPDHFDWKLSKLTFSVNLVRFEKMVIFSENSCHCNELQCILNEGDKLGADRQSVCSKPNNVKRWLKKKECSFKHYFNTLWYTYALPGRRAILRKSRRCAKQILAWCWDGIDYATMYTMQQYQLGFRVLSYIDLQIFILLAGQLLPK